MAFTTLSVTGNIYQFIPATAITSGTVTFTLSNAITDGSSLIVPAPYTVSVNASTGAFSATLTANDDTTTTPTGTYYSVLIEYETQVQGLPGAAGSVSFNVVVPHADAPSVDVFSLAQIGNPNPPAQSYVSQIQAGTNVTVSPAGGTGIVTVSSSGGSGGSAKVQNLGNISGAQTFDLSQGTAVTYTKVGNLTIGFSNWPSGGVETVPVLYETVGAGGPWTTTFTGVTWLPNGTPPVFASATGNVNEITLSSPDNGTHIYGLGSANGVSSIPYAASITPALPPSGNAIYNVGALTGAITINNPSGTPVDGQTMRFRLSQDGTGGRIITWGSAYVFGTDVPASLIPTAANSNYELMFSYYAAGSTWRALSIARGF